MEVVMLERYFVQPKTLDRIRASWIGKPIEQYVEWLTEHGYAARNVFHRVPILVHFGVFAEGHGATTYQELPNYICQFVDVWVREHGQNCKTDLALKMVACEARNPVEQMLRLLLPGYAGIGHPPRREMPFYDRAPGFFAYLREERGLQEVTVRHYQHYLRRFEKYLSRVALPDLRSLSPILLSSFVTDSSNSLCAKGLHVLCADLRVFLRYLSREQLIPHDMSRSVGSPQVYRLSDIPRSISWDQVERTLQAVDRRSPGGKRDYAILLLLVTYGLRAREVAGLTLEDIDWKRERLLVPERKAGHSTAYPLSSVVGQAILEYLRHGRPQTTDRHVFFRLLAPRTPLDSRVISMRASHYLHKAGIRVARPGSHTLRHTCVQRLVDAQFSLKTIGDYVGHRSPASTEIYTKVDIEPLRQVALGDGEDVL
jgi:site-specific recombinase XerD